MEFEWDETLFFVVAWGIGFVSATVRGLRDDRDNGTGNFLSSGLAGGFFAFGTICILLRYDNVSNSDRWFYLGVAALVGLMGKEQDLYSRWIVETLLKKLGITDPSKSDDAKKN